MSSFYNVGLQNVGSYQVSGIPFACHHGPSTAGEIVYFEFPNVSKSIYMHFDDNAGGHSVDYAFCEPKRAIDFSGTIEYLSTSFSSVEEFTVSAWIKMTGTITNVRLLQMTGGIDFRLQLTSTSNLRLIVNGTVENTVQTVSSGDWINVTVTSNGTENKLYLNGQFLIENTGDATGGFTGLDIGGTGTSGYDGIYDELVLFSKSLTEEEVSELYNGGAALKVSGHSQGTDMVSHWAFEDNNYKEFYQTPDTTTTIYDRKSNNNFSLAGGSAPLSFVDGRLIENALERHSITETGHQELTLNCKAKGILARFQSPNDELSIFASLTNIPASRMYDLTGPGIDE